MQQEQEQEEREQEEVEHDSREGFNAKSERSQGIYLNVFDGTICQKSKSEIEGWEGPIKTQNPQTKEDVFTFVFRYGSIVARIIDVNKFQKTFDSGGKTSGFNITLLAGGKVATLQLRWLEDTLKRFLKVAPNLDFNKSVRIACFPIIKPSGKRAVAVSFKQGDGPVPKDWPKVEEFYNTANEEMPHATQDEMDGTWDFKPQERFLGVKFSENTLPQIKQIAAQYPQFTTEAAQQTQPQATGHPQTERVSPTEFQKAKQDFAQSQPQIPAQASRAALQKPVPPKNPGQGVLPTSQPPIASASDDSFMDEVPMSNQAPPDDGDIPF